MNPSIFHLTSIGRAAENLERNEHMLNVLMNESALGTDGELNFDPKVMEGSYENEHGETIVVEGMVAREVECQWLPTDDNRLTPPDIRRGELVEVWRQGDSDKYYWRSMALRNDMRSLESVIYAWGATPELGGHKQDLSKCYIMSVSAHDKHVTIRTSKANEELYAYTIQINTKESAVYIVDDDGQMIELDSRERRLQLINKDNSFVKVEKKFIELNADEYIKLTVKDNVYKMVPDTTTLNTPKNIRMESGSLIRWTTNLAQAITGAFRHIKK